MRRTQRKIHTGVYTQIHPSENEMLEMLENDKNGAGLGSATSYGVLALIKCLALALFGIPFNPISSATQLKKDAYPPTAPENISLSLSIFLSVLMASEKGTLDTDDIETCRQKANALCVFCLCTKCRNTFSLLYIFVESFLSS